MRVELYGLTFEAPTVTFYLWSPWRASSVEHRLFDAIRQLPAAKVEQAPDEQRIAIHDAKAVKLGISSVERILKGWQEEASEAGGDRRTWRWLVEADTDSDGYDHNGDKASLWAFLRLSLERSQLSEAEKGLEEIDMNGFGMRIGGGEEK